MLKEGREGQGGRASRRWASLLTAGQIALAVMLLTAGGLFARSFFALYYTDPVVVVDHLVGMRLTLSQQYGSREERLRFVRRLDERLFNNSELSEATIGSDMPLNTFTALSRSVVMEGEVPDPKRPPRTAVHIATGPRYLETFKFPVRRGRALSPEDELPGREGAVVNERFAAMFFGADDPIGQRIRLSQPGPPPVPPPAWLTIVGVVPTVPTIFPIARTMRWSMRRCSLTRHRREASGSWCAAHQRRLPLPRCVAKWRRSTAICLYTPSRPCRKCWQ